MMQQTDGIDTISIAMLCSGLTAHPPSCALFIHPQEGAYLELRYVRIDQSARGLLRPANPLYEAFTPTGTVRSRPASRVGRNALSDRSIDRRKKHPY